MWLDQDKRKIRDGRTGTIYVTHLLRQNVYANRIDRNEFNRIYNYFKKLKKQGSLTTDKRLSAPVVQNKEQNLKIWFYYVNKSLEKRKNKSLDNHYFHFLKNILIVLLYGIVPLVVEVLVAVDDGGRGDGGDGGDDGRRDGGDDRGRDGGDDGGESTTVEPRTPAPSLPSEPGDDRLSTIPEETEIETDTTDAEGETSSATGAIAGAGTPYFGARRQTFIRSFGNNGLVEMLALQQH